MPDTLKGQDTSVQVVNIALKATMRIFAKFEKNHTITAMEQAITVKVADTPFLNVDCGRCVRN